MNKAVTFFLLLVLLFSFRNSVSGPEPVALTSSDTTYTEAPSELDLLMRKMYDHAVQVRKEVLMKKLPGPFPQEFLRIYTAKPADSLAKNEDFDFIADKYVFALNIFSSSDTGNIVQNYNNMVNTCIDCHSGHCPGPILKIRRLLLK